MKVGYRGYEIEAYREKCMGGYPLLYWSVMRKVDGFECESSFADTSDTVRTMISVLKERVDAELAEDGPWTVGFSGEPYGY